jgi:Arfaptin-like domain
MDVELSGGNGPANEEVQRNFSKHKEAYEKLRSDVTVKMQFLDENRVSEMYFLLNCFILMRITF